jgi:hypothetical protein
LKWKPPENPKKRPRLPGTGLADKGSGLKYFMGIIAAFLSNLPQPRAGILGR